MKLNTKHTIAAAAFAGLLAGATHANAFTSSSSDDHGTKVNTLGDKGKNSCKGKNACKGQGGCKASDNGCKGKNSCKGKGGCATDGSH